MGNLSQNKIYNYYNNWNNQELLIKNHLNNNNKNKF